MAMVEGTYDDCAIQVTESDRNKSEPLKIPAFNVDFTLPELSQIGNLRIGVRNVKIEFKSSEAGDLVYSGNCIGDLLHVKKGKSEVIVTLTGDGQYSDSELTLSDVSENTSELLLLGTVHIEATPPVLA